MQTAPLEPLGLQFIIARRPACSCPLPPSQTLTPSQHTHTKHTGLLLALQVIFSGGTEKSQPPLATRNQPGMEGWLWTQTPNHWASEDTNTEWVVGVLVPYMQRTNRAKGRAVDAACVLIIDCWPVQTTPQFREWMLKEYHWIKLMYVPPGCTSKLQPCDVSLQRPFKSAVQEAFCEYLCEEIVAQRAADGEVRRLTTASAV